MFTELACQRSGLGLNPRLGTIICTCCRPSLLFLVLSFICKRFFCFFFSQFDRGIGPL